MSQYFSIHPANPQKRLITQAAQIVRDGGVIVYPTDSCYAFGCAVGEADALERIRAIRRLDDKHHFTLACSDLSALGIYAKVDTAAFRLLRSVTPGPYTFILPATKLVPRRLQHPKRKSIGLRIPNHAIAQALLQELDAPLMTTTVQLPGDELPMTDAQDIRDRLEHHVDLVIDGGAGALTATTIIDLTTEAPTLVREGLGDVAWLKG